MYRFRNDEEKLDYETKKKFIFAVKQRPELYQKDNCVFKNRQIKDKIFEIIGNEIGVVDPVKKWKNLVDTYRRKKKAQLSDPTSSAKVPAWFKYMEFLEIYAGDSPRRKKVASTNQYLNKNTEFELNYAHEDDSTSSQPPCQPKVELTNDQNFPTISEVTNMSYLEIQDDVPPYSELNSPEGACTGQVLRFNPEHALEEIEKHPCIWNSRLSTYKDRTARAQAWQEISAETDVSVSLLRSKWKTLRDTYVRHKKRVFTGPIETSPILAKMQFLEDYGIVQSTTPVPQPVAKPTIKNIIEIDEDIAIVETSNDSSLFQHFESTIEETLENNIKQLISNNSDDINNADVITNTDVIVKDENIWKEFKAAAQSLDPSYILQNPEQFQFNDPQPKDFDSDFIPYRIADKIEAFSRFLCLELRGLSEYHANILIDDFMSKVIEMKSRYPLNKTI